eukprot:TRINITY_DN19953_c0_g1_i1.p1 TRINITY_DN19953_c0_g1~~TRINITY_DN19953_c0_g1_i1.p1  ORF type:complete len:430 (-),score=116.06 TRINITY_DN19953_c0_g1_i1:259-1548(-)
MVKRVGKYHLGKTLGEGTFGKVKQATDSETGKKFAVKVIDRALVQRENMIENVRKEIMIMKKIRHRNVINMVDVMMSKASFYLVMELATGGELFYKLANDGKFTEAAARRYFQHLIDGVDYCHQQAVCHRDLKPENLLLGDDDILKISDFGLSTLHSSNSSLLQTTCGTPNYVAPEVLQNQGYDGFRSDIWSCGVILFVFLAGYLPFEEPTTSELFRKIRAADYEFPEWFSSNAKDLVRKILTPNPAQRLTIAQIKQHPWFIVGYTSANHGSMLPTVGNLEFTMTEEVEDLKAKSANPAPVKMNAFELIHRAGAFDLSRMLQQGKADSGASTFTSFPMNKAIAEIRRRVETTATDLRCSITWDDASFQYRVSTRSSTGELTFSIEVIELAVNILYLLDFRRGKGDMLAFHKLYTSFRKQLDDKFVPTKA